MVQTEFRHFLHQELAISKNYMVLHYNTAIDDLLYSYYMAVRFLH